MDIITDRTMATKPTGRDKWITETAPKGHGRFCLRITRAGERIFYFRYTDGQGAQVRLPIGGYDSSGVGGLTLKEARAKAGELSLLYQSGIVDIKGHLEESKRIAEAERQAEEARVAAERKAAEVEAARLTVEGLFEKWFEMRVSKHKDGGVETRRKFEKDVLPRIGSLPAHLVRKGHVMEIADAIEQRGAPRVAKMVFASVRQMFRFALARDLVEIDPTAAISKAEVGGQNVERDRVLSDKEIRQLAAKMPTAGLMPTTEAAIWIVLATGCRIGELLKARWEHVDLEQRRWLIPAENSKNGDALEVHLSDFALRQFLTLEQHRRSDWLYPARWRDKETGEVPDSHVNIKTITKQIGDRQRETAMSKRSASTGVLALPGGIWTMHDLRRTASTIMGDLGIKPEVIDRCQNHREQNRVRRTYQRYSYQPEMRQAWDLLGERLDGLAQGKGKARVIAMPAIG